MDLISHINYCIICL